MKDHRSDRLSVRDSLSPEALREMSAAAHSNLFKMGELAPASTVMFYASFRTEVNTFPAMSRALQMGVRIVLPVTDPFVKTLTPRLVGDLKKDLHSGYRSIQEPDASRTEQIAVSEIDLVILPGSAFDRRGGRLGYGGGYYDRFLANRECRALRVGLGFELQIVDELPLKPHDQLLDVLITEKKIYRFNENSR